MFNPYALERKHPYALLTSLKYPPTWFGEMLVEAGQCLSGCYIHAILR